MKALLPIAAAVALALAAAGWFYAATRTGQDLLLDRFVAARPDCAAVADLNLASWAAGRQARSRPSATVSTTAAVRSSSAAIR